MDKTSMGAVRSRAKAEICSKGGHVCGRHEFLPLIYACPPDSGIVWPVKEIPQQLHGVRDVKLVSRINGCTVIWN
ncbi:MAG: hypothetical protein [Bacteriophage sp.]|nr:MAG: hypothetical protein [Bacteriophage sp.]